MSDNTIPDDLIPVLYSSLDVVSREQVGMVNAVTRDAKADSAAKGQKVSSPVVPALSAADTTPANTAPDASGITFTDVDVIITKSRNVSVPWTGEEQLSVDPNLGTMFSNTLAQAFRTLVNEIEADLVGLYTGFSRATGTAGTTPFASSIAAAATSRQILADNGAPLADIHLVVDSAAGANLRSLGQLSKVNEAGDGGAGLRAGVIGDVSGFMVGESGQISLHTKGAGTGYLVDDGSGVAVGDTSIHVDTGSGTLLAGDVITFAGNADKHVVTTGFTPGSGDEDLVIGAPGARATIADDAAMTIGDSYTPNLAFSRSAIVLASRLPAMPVDPISGVRRDQATETYEIPDPISGLTFRVAIYRQYHQIRVEIGIAWGVKLVKPEHTAILMG